MISADQGVCPSYTLACQIGRIHAWRGEVDAAFARLDTAFAQHDGGMMMITYDPFRASLHTDPRHAAPVRKMGLPK